MTLDCVFFEARNLKINFCFTIFGHFGIRKWKIIIWAVSCRWNRKIGPGIVWRPTWWPVHVHNYRNGTLKIIFFAFWKFHWIFSLQNFWKNHNLKTRIERRIWIFWGSMKHVYKVKNLEWVKNVYLYILAENKHVMSLRIEFSTLFGFRDGSNYFDFTGTQWWNSGSFEGVKQQQSQKSTNLETSG